MNHLTSKIQFSTLLILFLASTVTYGQGDAAAGKAKAATCNACHGPGGNSQNPLWPKLAAQHAPYIVKQLKDFKSGARKNALMSPQAAALSEQDMQNLAAYYTAQKSK